MIAVDSNILVYAHRRDSAWHQRAARSLTGLAQGRSAWAIPWPCIHEFLAIVTHPRIYVPPSSLTQAIEQVEAWAESPSVILLTETDTYWGGLKECLRESRVAGPQIHDARIATICRHHGVRELWTADRDFSRFPQISIRNPLV